MPQAENPDHDKVSIYRERADPKNSRGKTTERDKARRLQIHTWNLQPAARRFSEGAGASTSLVLTHLYQRAADDHPAHHSLPPVSGQHHPNDHSYGSVDQGIRASALPGRGTAPASANNLPESAASTKVTNVIITKDYTYLYKFSNI
ncbi:MAG: hypothetical protein ACLFWD_11015 [Anaerolineales bacterium]